MIVNETTCKKYLLVLVFAILFTPFSLTHSQQLVISEFMAINDTVLADEDGDFSDWIELYNAGSTSFNLDGWYITDNPLNLDKWRFPAITLNAGDYLVIFASEKNRTLIAGNLHTNFKLSGSGEFLAIVEPDGTTISSSFGDAFPAQQANISYGLYNGQYVYMQTPSPGTANVIGDFVLQPDFSHERGFYNSPFNVELTSAGTNIDIYYTTDGTRPNLITGTKYTSPVTITKTTVLSAVAIDKTTSNESYVVTHTYLFVDSIMAQSNNPAGYPDQWGDDPSNKFPADYEMDLEICTAANRSAIEEALKSLPTVSLVTDISHLFSDEDNDTTGGIYIYTQRTTEEWERPVSMEYYDSAQHKSFQVNCGLRLHGGNSRKPGNSPKHSFRVSFRGEYGPTKLNFNLFDEKSAVNEFNSLVLRAGYNYSWIKNAPVQCEGADFIRDPFAKKTQLDMDRTAAHNKFVHLYINGLYWGVYNISEKITNDFAESYLGGQEDDYDVVKDHNGIVDGSRITWDSLLAATSNGFETLAKYERVQGNNADGSVNLSYLKLLDARNFIDYMLVNFYIGNADWDKNNWIVARNRVSNGHGFKYFSWDAETSMNELEANMVNLNNSGNPSGIYQKLRDNEEFRLYFADRVHKHFFNGGALTPEKAEERYMDMANTIEKGLLAESARWGDYRRDVDPGIYTYELYTPGDQWQERVGYMQTTYLQQRTDTVLKQLKEIGLYPDIDAPEFSPFGGEFEDTVKLGMAAGEITDTIYYTIDDTDPREVGGTLAISRAFMYLDSLQLTGDVIIKARSKRGSMWSALTRAKFKIEIPPIVPSVPILISPANEATVKSDSNLTFMWNKCEDDDSIWYALYIFNSNDTLAYSNLPDTSIIVSAYTFAQHDSFSWKVVVSDSLHEVESDMRSFITYNMFPGTFSITTPGDNDTLDASNDIVFNWTRSTDDDSITYSMSISDGTNIDMYHTTDTFYILPGNNLINDKTYNIQVSASDGISTVNTSAITLFTRLDIEEFVNNETLIFANLYPNPAKDYINIQLGTKQLADLQIELYDITGKRLQIKTMKNILGTRTISMNLKEYSKGIYLVVIRDDGGVMLKTERVVVN